MLSNSQMKTQNSKIRRGALALLLESRRRFRSVPAPVITAGFSSFNRTETGWFDVVLDFDFDQRWLPPATFEVWLRRDSDGELDFKLLALAGTDIREFIHVLASMETEFYTYKLRYRSGRLISPFSEEYSVDF
jgi:hypothetical protein